MPHTLYLPPDVAGNWLAVQFGELTHYVFRQTFAPGKIRPKNVTISHWEPNFMSNTGRIAPDPFRSGRRKSRSAFQATGHVQISWHIPDTMAHAGQQQRHGLCRTQSSFTDYISLISQFAPDTIRDGRRTETLAY